MQNQQSVGE